MSCEAELCRNWTGQGCACEFLGLEPDVVCTGGYTCPAPMHEHGCRADEGNCDDPDEHSTE